MQATQQDMFLGTVAYMAPGQASGASVDKRADVWDFGCALFEMLGGRQMLTGESLSHILAGVRSTEPEWDRLPGATSRSDPPFGNVGTATVLVRSCPFCLSALDLISSKVIPQQAGQPASKTKLLPL